MKTLILAVIGSIIFSPLSEAGIGGFGSLDGGRINLVDQHLKTAIAQAEAGADARESIRIAREVAATIEAQEIKIRIAAMLNNKDLASDAREVLERAAREVREQVAEIKKNVGAGIFASSTPVRGENDQPRK